jgi:hypothetical protein
MKEDMPKTNTHKTEIKPDTTKVEPPIIETNPEIPKTENNTITILKSGSFQDSSVHKASGTTKIIKTGEKIQAMLVDFKADSGPDLYVYLVKNDKGDAKSDSFLDLGKLSKTSGSLNFDIPQNTKIDEYKSIVIWCKQFGVNFGFATIKN